MKMKYGLEVQDTKQEVNKEGNIPTKSHELHSSETPPLSQNTVEDRNSRPSLPAWGSSCSPRGLRTLLRVAAPASFSKLLRSDISPY